MAIVADLEAVHRDVTRLMQRVYGDRLTKIILYGSYARGDFHEETDIDYLVVLHDEKVSAFMEAANTRPAISEVFDDSGIEVSTIVVSNDQLINSNRFFYRQVRKDGVCIYERGSVLQH
ncbi:nucleotidyltransferase domain-containing protein [Spirosoma sp. KUDC1026]|uniref:nucleotidyltransferase domain-containing protein n=1 Tax=Spirosoma sp. KUDC1026 TaxID=2745947 RepID=UPI00159BEE9A|nr:nucleotidyltransferase domain-containing protein [Spirosoma sp. KUDC1026]QKZ11505.1 nucleotidyltransferase domain-containing protein [Spirosoma sp. KUDC1026]